MTKLNGFAEFVYRIYSVNYTNKIPKSAKINHSILQVQDRLRAE